MYNFEAVDKEYKCKRSEITREQVYEANKEKMSVND